MISASKFSKSSFRQSGFWWEVDGVDGKDVFAEDDAGDMGIGPMTGSDSSTEVVPGTDDLWFTKLLSLFGAEPEQLYNNSLAPSE